jgi:hypothetical protein
LSLGGRGEKIEAHTLRFAQEPLQALSSPFMAGTHVLMALIAPSQLLMYVVASSFVVGLFTLSAILIKYTFVVIYG